jgi:hypothetical protein
MSGAGAYLWLFGFGIVVIAILVFGYLAKQKRLAAFVTAATQLGLTYAPEDPFGTVNLPFPLFSKGDGRGVENVLYGAWQGTDVRAFDYWYYDESTDGRGHTSRSYSRFDCAVLELNASCRSLTIAPENLLTRLADHLALHDIQFESEVFNTAFNVKSEDRKFANDLIDARMQGWLLMHGEGFSFEVAGERLLCSCRKIDPTGFATLLGTAKGFRDQVPTVVASLYPKNVPG